MNIANINCIMKESDVIIKKLNSPVSEELPPFYKEFYDNMHKSFKSPSKGVTALLNMISSQKDIYKNATENNTNKNVYTQQDKLADIPLSDITNDLFILKGVEMPPIDEPEYGKKIKIDATFILTFLVFSLYNALRLFFEIVTRVSSYKNADEDVSDVNRELMRSIELIKICSKLLDNDPEMLDIYFMRNLAPEKIKDNLLNIYNITIENTPVDIYSSSPYTRENQNLKEFNRDEYLFTNLPELYLVRQKAAIKNKNKKSEQGSFDELPNSDGSTESTIYNFSSSDSDQKPTLAEKSIQDDSDLPADTTFNRRTVPIGY